MKNTQIQITHILPLFLLLMFCSAVTQAQGVRNESDLPLLDLDTPIRLDFSGSWEKDFARSDKWEDELNRVLRVRRDQATLQQSGVRTGRAPRVSLGNINLNSSSARGASIIELAQLAEYINRQSTMEIKQDRNEVRIERAGEAPLVCSLEYGPMSTFSSAHGTEICGWDEQQLVFQITLPEELVITHRFTVDADGQELRMVTSIRSKSSAPFNLRQSFNRFDSAGDTLNCIMTATRGRVCSQVTPLN